MIGMICTDNIYDTLNCICVHGNICEEVVMDSSFSAVSPNGNVLRHHDHTYMEISTLLFGDLHKRDTLVNLDQYLYL